MAEIVVDTFEILEGDITSPAKIMVNGDELDVDSELWEKAYTLVTSVDGGMGYTGDEEDFDFAVINVYLEFIETAKDASEEALDTGEPVILEGDLPLSSSADDMGTIMV